MSELTSGYLPALGVLVVLLFIGAILTRSGQASWWKTFRRNGNSWALFFAGGLFMVMYQRIVHQVDIKGSIIIPAFFVLMTLALTVHENYVEPKETTKANPEPDDTAAHDGRPLQDFPTYPTAKKRR